MLSISCVLALIPNLKDSFFSANERLVGFFQYSNSFALYMLIGICILINKEKKKKNDIILGIALTLGIILTKSRFTFLIGLIYMMYCIFELLKKRKSTKYAAIGIIVLVAIIIIIFAVMQNNIRIFKISLNESTLIGRLIYNLDGLKILLKYPFGVGYMGYSYIYPTVQTANYSVKFIHNDLLQQGVDTGIIPMIILMALWVYNIFSKKTEKLTRQLLIIMFAHLIFDFNMQFTIFEFIIVLLLEQQEIKTIIFKNKNKITNILLCSILIFIYIYFGIGDIADHLGNYSLSLDLIPNKTSAIINEMAKEPTLTKAAKLADKLIDQNKYVVPAYKVKVDHAFDCRNWQEMCECQQIIISLRKYNIEKYEEYVLLISKALDITVNSSNEADTKYLISQLGKIKPLLEQTKQQTSNLAYSIKDSPELELKEEIVKYINDVTLK